MKTAMALLTVKHYNIAALQLSQPPFSSMKIRTKKDLVWKLQLVYNRYPWWTKLEGILESVRHQKESKSCENFPLPFLFCMCRFLMLRCRTGLWFGWVNFKTCLYLHSERCFRIMKICVGHTSSMFERREHFIA